MGFSLTLGLAAGLVLLSLFAGWGGARPPDPRRGPRMIPWRFIMTLAAMGAFVMAVHLVNLLGFTTGRP
jgi:hypothetical protein